MKAQQLQQHVSQWALFVVPTHPIIMIDRIAILFHFPCWRNHNFPFICLPSNVSCSTRTEEWGRSRLRGARCYASSISSIGTPPHMLICRFARASHLHFGGTNSNRLIKITHWLYPIFCELWQFLIFFGYLWLWCLTFAVSWKICRLTSIVV